jgi:hypothetical protein
LSAFLTGTTFSGTSFTEKAIDITITLGQGQNGLSAGSSVTLTGLRTTATINNPAPPDMGWADVKVYGVTFDIMMGLTNVLDAAYSARNNVIDIKAGDKGNTILVFHGILNDAWMNFDGMPETCMELKAYSSTRLALQMPLKESSVDGPSDPAVMIQNVITQAGLNWKLNNQVNTPVTLSSHVANQSPWPQINAIAQAANYNISYTDVDPGVVNIWNKGFPLPGAVTAQVSPATGMVGYPLKVHGSQIRIKTLFNNNIVYGGQVQVSGSQITIANGMWTMYEVVHDLAANLPGGPWFTTFTGWSPNLGFPNPSGPDGGV